MPPPPPFFSHLMVMIGVNCQVYYTYIPMYMYARVFGERNLYNVNFGEELTNFTWLAFCEFDTTYLMQLDSSILQEQLTCI